MTVFRHLKKKEETPQDDPFVFNSEALRRAWETLARYRAAKAGADARIEENERLYRMETVTDESGLPKPTSGWLFNCIQSKHADAMDAFPEPVVLPREEEDKAEAENLSAILPALLDQCDFEQVFSDATLAKLKHGTGVYGIFWDGTMHGGLGDVSIRKIDLRHLFWEPGVTDIQDSADVFLVRMEDRLKLAARYPDAHIGQSDRPSPKDPAALLFGVTTGRIAVVDHYYKKAVGGKTVLHFAKFTSDTILYATENDPAYAERGLYDHGEYPFVFDVLFRNEDSAAGFGYMDVGRNAQTYIDKGNEAILQNLLVNATPRHFIREDGEVSEAEFADIRKPFVHVRGSLGEDALRPVPSASLDRVYLNVLDGKISELKEITGNRDTINGGTVSGVTAASAIFALQEAGNKLTRDCTNSSYRAFRRICLLTVELIRQFYDLPRRYRIPGRPAEEQFVIYTNANLRRNGLRKPLFDIEIGARKTSPYSRLSQNELALNLYNAGIFSPERATEALLCLDMMDIDRKQDLIKKIRDNAARKEAST